MAALTDASAAPERCPVCPHSGLRPTDLSCPACGTDLSVLRRVQELPLALLDEGSARLAEGDVRGARRALRRASAFGETRERALLLLGALEAERGRLRAAARHWQAAERLGESSVPRESLASLEASRSRPTRSAPTR